MCGCGLCSGDRRGWWERWGGEAGEGGGCSVGWWGGGVGGVGGEGVGGVGGGVVVGGRSRGWRGGGGGAGGEGGGRVGVGGGEGCAGAQRGSGRSCSPNPQPMCSREMLRMYIVH